MISSCVSICFETSANCRSARPVAVSIACFSFSRLFVNGCSTKNRLSTTKTATSTFERIPFARKSSAASRASRRPFASRLSKTIVTRWICRDGSISI